MLFARSFLATAALLALVKGAPAQQPIAPGAAYLEFNAAGPNRVFVVSVDRTELNLDLELGFPYGRRDYPARQTVPQIAANYDDPPENDVVAAVNGGFFGTGIDITGTLGSGSNLLGMPDLSRNWPEMAFTDSGDFLVYNDSTITDNQVRFADGSSVGMDLINRDPIADGLVAYTPEWGLSTASGTQGTEVVLTGVNYPFRPGKEMVGTVALVGTGAGSLNNTIPAGGAVLNALGTKAATLAVKAIAGEQVRFRLRLSNAQLLNQHMMQDGAGWILRDGSPYTSEWTRYSTSFTGRQPRTAIGWNDTNYFLVVIDGRTATSVGMSFAEMATFFHDTLGATDAVNFDGGGSSTMVINGLITNSPSDGTARTVGNAIMLVARQKEVERLEDDFGPGGRTLPWDDKFTLNPVQAFSPAAPGGDGHVMVCMDPAGGFETTHVGNRWDQDTFIEADVYCEYRPDEPASGSEFSGLYLRDAGQQAFDTNYYGGGNNYLIAFDARTGEVRTGKTTDGVYTAFQGNAPVYTESGWHRFRLSGVGDRIIWSVDGRVVLDLVDSDHPAGFAGVGFRESYTDDTAMHGARVDNLKYGPMVDDGDLWMAH